MPLITYSRKELDNAIERLNRSISLGREMYLISGSKITMERILNETARRNGILELLSANPEQQEFDI